MCVGQRERHDENARRMEKKGRYKKLLYNSGGLWFSCLTI